MNNDGILDAAEFDGLFYLQEDRDLTANARPDGVGHMQVADKHNEDEMDNYIHGGYGTYNKRPLHSSEILQLP